MVFPPSVLIVRQSGARSSKYSGLQDYSFPVKNVGMVGALKCKI